MKKVFRTSIYILVAIVCLGAALASCTGSLRGTEVSGSAELANMLPPFPTDDSPGRVSSDQTQSIVDGSAFFSKSDAALVNGMQLEIDAVADTLEYAIYRHEIGFETTLSELTVDLTATGGDGAWVYLANYDMNSWQRFGPTFSEAVIPLPASNFLSTNFNNFFVAVIAFDGTFVEVVSSTLSYESGVAPPSTYVGTMQPIFDANCMPCHSSGSATAGIVLDSYWQAFDDADAALAKILADHAPTGSGSMTTEEKESFQAWVDGGKEYGSEVTYTNFVVNLTTMSCSPCHTGGGNSGGVNWDTYASSFPKGEVAWQRIKSGSMPQGGPALPDSDKDKWLAWVEQGKPE